MLEGDFAVLSLLGSPLRLTIQLQQSNLNLADALWTAKVQRELSPPSAEVPNSATHSCMPPTEKQSEPFQQDNEEVANDGEWTVVKRKPHAASHVSKTLKLRAPRRVGEYVQQ